MAAGPVDAYIAAAEPFAQPILKRVRAAFQRVCPEVKEALKWRQPSFLYRGGILAVMGAFKKHVRFHFWHASALPDPHGLLKGNDERDSVALKWSAEADLPSDALLDAYIVLAVQFRESGGKPEPLAAKQARPALKAPPDLLEALRSQPAAEKVFTAFAPSHRREYVEWILGAKREITRQQRIRTTVEWLSEGKPLHWKYGRTG